MTTLTETINAILDGTFDEDFDAIRGAIKERAAIKSRSTFFTVKVGDKATLANLNPKYLIGAPVTIVKKNQTRIVVKIDAEWFETHPNVYKWRGEITAKPNMLNMVVADAEAA